MELFSKEVIEQIQQAKAAREAAKVEAVEPKGEAEDEEYSNYNPFLDDESNADPEMDGKRGMFQASW